MVSRSGITQRQQRGLWYYHGLRTCGEETFLPIFHTTYRAGGNSVKQHIFKLMDEDQQGKSQKPISDTKKEKLYKKQFYELQRRMLEGQTPLKDISLLYSLLRNSRICDLATDDSVWLDKFQKLEYGIHFIKCERDKISHRRLELSEQEYNERMVHLMDTVKGMLLEAGTRFNHDFSQLSSSICHKMKRIQETNVINNLDPSNTEHWQKLKNIMKLRQEHEERDALNGMIREITGPYEELCQVQPAPWLLRDDRKAKLPKIFVSMELQGNDAMHKKCGEKVAVTHDQLLKVKRPDGTNPTLVIVQGEGGAGKSTLMKLVLFHWMNKTDEIKGLSSVPLILYSECRETAMESLDDLLQHYCPTTTSSYGSDRLKQIVMSQSLIIIVDGYDEINSSSKKLLNEILSYTGDHIKVFVTTRPMHARELTTIVPETKRKINLQILGIQKEQQPEFVTKLMQVFLDNSQKVQEEADKLMEQVRGMTGEMRSILRNPLNLSLTVLMWVENREKINSLTSMTALFTTFRELTVGKVAERLLKRGLVMSQTEAEDKCQVFLQHFDELAYETDLRGEFQFKTETVRELRRRIGHFKLVDDVEEDFFSSFFTTKLSREQLRLTRIYSFRHRLEQQYSCASHLATLVTQPTPHMTLTQLLTQDGHDLARTSEEVMMFLTGILYMKKVLPTFATEIIDTVNVKIEYDTIVHLDALLHHLTECNRDDSLVQAVQARLDHCYVEGKRTWFIGTDWHLCSLHPLLTSKSAEDVVFSITENTSTLAHLHPVLQDVVQRGIRTDLGLDYNRENHRETDATDDAVLSVFADSPVLEAFEGRISEDGVRLLPESLLRLDVRVGVDVLPHLATRLPNLHNLNHLELVIFLGNIPEPETVARLQYYGQELELILECPDLQDYQAGRLATWLGNLWPTVPTPKIDDWIDIEDTNLTVTGIQILLEDLVATRPDDRSGQAEALTFQDADTTKDLEDLVATSPDDRREEWKRSSSPDATTSRKLVKFDNNKCDTSGDTSCDRRGSESGSASGSEKSDARGVENCETSGSESDNTSDSESDETSGSKDGNTSGSENGETNGPVILETLKIYTNQVISREDKKHLKTLAKSYGIRTLFLENLNKDGAENQPPLVLEKYQ